MYYASIVILTRKNWSAIYPARNVLTRPSQPGTVDPQARAPLRSAAGGMTSRRRATASRAIADRGVVSKTVRAGGRRAWPQQKARRCETRGSVRARAGRGARRRACRQRGGGRGTDRGALRVAGPWISRLARVAPPRLPARDGDVRRHLSGRRVLQRGDRRRLRVPGSAHHPCLKLRLTRSRRPRRHAVPSSEPGCCCCLPR
jgi:hypothetical protein